MSQIFSSADVSLPRRNPSIRRRSTGASTTVAHQLSATAALTENFSALYKTQDFNDALYAFSTALAASVTQRTQVKIEFLDTYKNLVAPTIEKNDIAVIVGLVYKR